MIEFCSVRIKQLLKYQKLHWKRCSFFCALSSMRIFLVYRSGEKSTFMLLGFHIKHTNLNNLQKYIQISKKQLKRLFEIRTLKNYPKQKYKINFKFIRNSKHNIKNHTFVKKSRKTLDFRQI